ncbi:hypothetical protein [Sediminitomix flava]|uniref:Uncharacterized protein n=1 Tax=Sediminitomix flava TaxID=379075 RepID=A0A315ZCG1_SEDFL|nr:hypothetical protein [Sediminitomix flava]PWJ43266.1 hypothetical protein BC781_102815 [Sediminitomix flava]
MHNSPELDGKYLGKITKDFARLSNTLKEAAYQLKARKISDYPIFVVSKGEAGIGQLLVGRNDIKELEWDFNFSFLQEFLDRNIILEENVKSFQESYKDPDEFCCLFVIDEDFIKFIYVPYPEDED